MSLQISEIQHQLDWLAEVGIDWLDTESGLSEFTHPDDISMLTWMNETSNYALNQHNIPVYIKCHCSTGQYCQHYNDSSSHPLNFNFLPQEADLSLGVMPHTVQV